MRRSAARWVILKQLDDAVAEVALLGLVAGQVFVGLAPYSTASLISHCR